MTSTLEEEIFRTIKYFHVLGLPVTATHIWRGLLQSEHQEKQRWGGRALVRLSLIERTLRTSAALRDRVGTKWGYWFLKGQAHLVRKRLDTHVLAQHKWRVARRAAKFLAAAPFVRGIFGSGSLALDNPHLQSDLDFFVIVRAERIWTARLFALIAAQLTGRRRKHWDRLAPDKICLNHYITDNPPLISSAIRNVHTAVTYTHLVPLMGLEVFARFQRFNAPWMKRYLMYPDPPLLAHQYAVSVARSLAFIKSLIERFLLEPVGDVVEHWAEKLQRRAILRHTDPRRGGRIAVSDHELAFHPDSKVPAILRAFGEEVGQKTLW